MNVIKISWNFTCNKSNPRSEKIVSIFYTKPVAVQVKASFIPLIVCLL